MERGGESLLTQEPKQPQLHGSQLPTGEWTLKEVTYAICKPEQELNRCTWVTVVYWLALSFLATVKKRESLSVALVA